MNKSTLRERVKALELPVGSYCVLAGGAMLFYGLREQTNDVDLHVNETAFSLLLQTQKLITLHEERRHYAIGEDIELYVTDQTEIVFEIHDGICVQTPQAILELKQNLNRPKDAKDIAALKEYIELKKYS